MCMCVCMLSWLPGLGCDSGYQVRCRAHESGAGRKLAWCRAHGSSAGWSMARCRAHESGAGRELAWCRAHESGTELARCRAHVSGAGHIMVQGTCFWRWAQVGRPRSEQAPDKHVGPRYPTPFYAAKTSILVAVTP